jgi:hypothetical protein
MVGKYKKALKNEKVKKIRYSDSKFVTHKVSFSRVNNVFFAFPSLFLNVTYIFKSRSAMSVYRINAET